MSQYEGLSKEQLIEIIEKQNQKLIETKYGINWDRERIKENVVLLCEKQHPVLELKCDSDIITNDSTNHILIEGDNYHALNILTYTHLGKIDIIYIDPPYNTGNKDFVYNDAYVDVEDGYRHSKWLSFMEKRLRIARNLLSDEGIIYISIDDNELFQLKLLCDAIFGEQMFIGSLPRLTKKGGKSSSTFAKNHDYVLVYAKKEKDVFLMDLHFDEGYSLRDEHFETRGLYKLNQTLDYNSLQYNKKMDYLVTIDNEVFCPGGDIDTMNQRHSGMHLPIDWVWRWSKAKLDFGLENDFVVIKRSKNGRPRIYTKTYQNASIDKDENGYYVKYVERRTPLSSIRLIENEFSNDNAKKELDELDLSEKFDYPKPTSLIEVLVRIYKKRNPIILDFFAGSGTTGHAVLKLNNYDKGNRQFILCTNNENGICEKITYPRLKKVILGYVSKKGKIHEGLGGESEALFNILCKSF